MIVLLDLQFWIDSYILLDFEDSNAQSLASIVANSVSYQYNYHS